MPKNTLKRTLFNIYKGNGGRINNSLSCLWNTFVTSAIELTELLNAYEGVITAFDLPVVPLVWVNVASNCESWHTYSFKLLILFH